MSTNKSVRSPQLRRLVRPILISGLAATGLFQVIPRVIAATAAGTSIVNTATATYEDPNNPGNKIPTESNTVTITVAEVAGITNVAQVPIDVNGGSVIQGDSIQFPFIITNTGNAATNIFIPGANNVTATNLTGVSVEVDLGAGFVPVPATGLTTTTPVAAGSTIIVRIVGTVAAVPVGTTVNAKLGNTGSSLSSNPNSQNQPDIGTDGDTGGEITDVRSVDANSGNGAPVGGEKEAADTSINLIVGQTPPSPLALAKIKKTNGGVVINNPQLITDDEITYNLSLEVSSTSPNVNFTPGNLEGTPITLDASTQNKILISDVIPTGTVLKQVPTAPAGWTVVYSVNDPTTTIPILFTGGTAAAWTTVAPTLSTVKRIGFIKADPQLINNSTTVISGFNFTVVTSGATGSTFNVDNVAQVLGQTAGVDPNNTPANQADDPVVFDESGDNNPLNFRDDGTPPDTNADGQPDAFNPANDRGIPSDSDGFDTNNNNTGTDTPGDTSPDGEVNRVTVNTFATSLLNGPNGAPDAVGPNDFNNDFQNQSLPSADFAARTIAANPDNTTINNPSPVPFTNTFRNNSGVQLDNVVLRPIAASQAETATTTIGQGRFTVDANGDAIPDTIPLGTTSTITVTWDPVTQTQGAPAAVTQTATYTYQANGISPGVDGFVLTSGTPIDLDNVPVGLAINYGVIVELPLNTPQLRGYSVPVIAYVNNDVQEQFNPVVETTFNLTIDRLYSGYLKLLKQARLLQGTGPAITGGQGAFTANGASLTPAPGNIIEYQVSYSNISTPTAGTSTRVLNANLVNVEEDGNAVGNNWAVDQDNLDLDGNVATGIDTSHVIGSAIGTQGTIQFFNNNNDVTPGVEQSGVNASNDVTKYLNAAGTVTPGGTGTFTFQRKIN